MTSMYESIVAGLNEAMAFARGEDTGAVIHHIDVPTIDVAKIRAQTGLSQAEFARSIGVARGRSMAAAGRPARRRCCWP